MYVILHHKKANCNILTKIQYTMITLPSFQNRYDFKNVSRTDNKTTNHIEAATMSKKEDIRHIWRECFKDSDEYLDMYFDRIYRDGDAMTISVDGKTVSSLLSQPYKFLFYGQELPISYLSGAATRRPYRGKGFMSSLMAQAIRNAYDRGDMLCALIPAHDYLYFFFDRFDFSTVFLTDTQRYTSLHTFNAPTEHEYHTVEDHYSDETYQAFTEMEHQRGSGVVHSQRQFIDFLDELAMRKGGTFIVVGREDRQIAAMAWAMATDDAVHVFEVLGVDSDSRRAALCELRKVFPDKPFRYLAPANDKSSRQLHSRGMARIVNVKLCLQTIAEANPDWRCTIRVHDYAIAENNHTFVVEEGKVTIDDNDPQRLDFVVDIDVLNRIVFSSPKTGSVLNFPSQRPHIALMPH